MLALALILPSCLPAAAGAQDAAESAEALFERGMEEVRAGLYGLAVAHFRRSLSVEPRVSTAVNLAGALRSVGAERRAEAILDDVLAGAYGRVGRHLRASIDEQLTAIRAHLCSVTLVVTAAEPGAEAIHVSVDGREVSRLDTPGQVLLRVDPGERTISAVAPGYRVTTVRRSLAVGAHETIELELAPFDPADLALLTLVTDDPNAILEIAGYGQSARSISRELSAGTYVVRAIGGAGVATRTIDLHAGAEEEVRLQPPTRGLEEEPWLWITIGLVLAAGAAVGITWWLTNPTPVTDPYWGSPQALVRF